MPGIAQLTVLILTAARCLAAGDATPYQPVPGAFGMTKWAADITPGKVLPEYPRPLMVRKEWLNLNGLWDYRVASRSLAQPDFYQGKILVPFPIEAPLSGIGRMLNAMPDQSYRDSRLWYRRYFEVPDGWKDRRTLLHFGAVDWEATVFLNGNMLGEHRGGYDGFSFDVTAALIPNGRNELIVAVWDPTSEGRYPCGKQICKPGGIFYTPCTGIWQTAWLEPVAKAAAIRDLTLVPDIDHNLLRLTVATQPENAEVRVRAIVMSRRASIWASTESGTCTAIWSPSKSALYAVQTNG